MRKFRFVLVALVVLAVAQPTFACLFCNEYGRCQFTTETVPKCKFLIAGGCEDGQNLCLGGGGPGGLAEEWEVASVEVKRSNESAPGVQQDARPLVADARVSQLEEKP